MTHEELKALLPLAALDQLEPQEADALREHLRGGCDECDMELRELEHAVAMLALLDDPASSVTASSAEARVAKKLEARLAAPIEAPPPAIAEEPKPVAIQKPPPRKGVSKIAFGFAMAAALLLALYGVGVTRLLMATQQQYQDELTALETRFTAVQAQARNAEMKAAALLMKAPESGQLEKVLDAPDLRLTRLAPVGPAPQAHALVALSTASNKAVVRASGLPPAPSGKTYEMWWITKQKGPVPAGLFNPQPGQEIVAQIEPPPSGQRVTAAAVTLEAAGGAQKPSADMYLKGSSERE